METTNKDIQEINQHISDSLKQWSEIMLLADSDEWSYYLNYNSDDVLHAIHICSHVLQNVAIKSGHIKDEKDAHEKGSNFRKAIKDFCGLDPKDLFERNK